MKPVFTVIVCLLTALVTEVSAQQKGADVIYLKNGERIAGEIVSYEQGGKLILRKPDGVEVEFNDADISKIVQGEALPKEAESKKPNEPFNSGQPRMKGFYNTVSISFGLGGGNAGNGLTIAAGLHNVTGYQWSRLLGTGLGFGIDNYSRQGETIFPFFAEVRSFLPAGEKGRNYYFSLMGGYGFAFKREKLDIYEAEGGWMAHPVVGFRTITKEGTDVNLDFGVKFQKAFFIRQLQSGDIEERDILYRRFTIRIGLTLW